MVVLGRRMSGLRQRSYAPTREIPQLAPIPKTSASMDMFYADLPMPASMDDALDHSWSGRLRLSQTTIIRERKWIILEM